MTSSNKLSRRRTVWFGPDKSHRPSASPRLFAGAALIAGLSFFVYLPSLNGGFILDDNLLLTENPLIKAPDGVLRFWYTTQQPDYVPLTCTTLWFEWRLWGMNRRGYHFDNLVLHIAGCVLLWTLLQRLSIPGAYLAALLFAVHPVNVESVAWIEQRKNTLALVLFLLAVLWYLKAEERREARDERRETATNEKRRKEEKESRGAARFGRWYWLSLFAFLLAMFSKGSVAILPGLLLLIAWWRQGGLTKRDLVRSAPFFVLAAVLTPVIVWFVTHDFGDTVRNANFSEHLLGAGGVVWFYLSKALLPIHLVFVYPQWQIPTAVTTWWLLPLLAAVAVTAVLWRHRGSGWGRALFFAWCWFCVALIPVMGLTDVGFMQFSLVADHYQQIALIGPVALASAGWAIWRLRARSPAKPAIAWLAVVAIGVSAFLTWRQSRLFADPVALYRDTLANNPTCSMIHNNLGLVLTEQGRLDEAIEHLQRAVQLKPDYAESHNNLGVALAKIRRPEQALEQFQQALHFRPEYPEAHFNMGLVLAGLGRADEAIKQYDESLRLRPDYPDARNGLGIALAGQGRTLDAIAQFQAALDCDPDYAEAQNNLAVALVRAGRLAAAIDHYQRAIAIKPEYTDAYSNMANAYARMNRLPEAIAAVQRALELARLQGDTALVGQLESSLNEFRARQSRSKSAADSQSASP